MKNFFPCKLPAAPARIRSANTITDGRTVPPGRDRGIFFRRLPVKQQIVAKQIETAICDKPGMMGLIASSEDNEVEITRILHEQMDIENRIKEK